MKKFLVLYKCPIAVVDDWKAKPVEETQPVEAKMQTEWKEWMMAHGASVKETAGAGKTKSVNTTGVSDIKNDIMLYSIVEAESHDSAANLFVGHPHLGIPEATIEIMEINPMSGM